MAKDNSKPADSGRDEDGFIVLNTDRKVYKAKSGVQIQGVMLGMVNMPAGANGRPWQAIIVKVTKPTKAQDRDKVEHDVPAGEEVFVPLTHQLRQHLATAACHSTHAFEVRIVPLKKVSTRSGEMWTFQIAVSPRPILRNGELRFIAASSAKALPQTTEPGDEEIPF